ncbi:hypothetical protein AVEN_39641-1 [Araneus ventricosus]|uniref:Uncharacterized protein n=1 Tax=Araneus ventricosus TaxID=182803 RepID=A0A4Y2S290_ARAVE|nr:hypothetical protein AVEN_39641-1 [Araneus ventricosus]
MGHANGTIDPFTMRTLPRYLQAHALRGSATILHGIIRLKYPQELPTFERLEVTCPKINAAPLNKALYDSEQTPCSDIFLQALGDKLKHIILCQCHIPSLLCSLLRFCFIDAAHTK